MRPFLPGQAARHVLIVLTAEPHDRRDRALAFGCEHDRIDPPIDLALPAAEKAPLREPIDQANEMTRVDPETLAQGPLGESTFRRGAPEQHRLMAIESHVHEPMCPAPRRVEPD